jgi:acyl carrier protein
VTRAARFCRVGDALAGRDLRCTRPAPDYAIVRMTPSTFDAISAVLVDQFHVEAATVQPSVALDQLGLDSLALMELVFAVEDRFSVRIPEDRLDPRQAGVTLEQLALLLDEAIAAKASSDVVSG